MEGLPIRGTRSRWGRGRAAVAVGLAAALALGARPAAAEEGALGVSLGVGPIFGDAESSEGMATGWLGTAEYVLWRGSWFTPRLYAGAHLTSDDAECAAGVSPCALSAQYALVGAKARLSLPTPWASPFLELGVGGSAGRFTNREGEVSDLTRTGALLHTEVGFGLAFGAEGRHALGMTVVTLAEAGLATATFTYTYELPIGAARAREAPPAVTGPVSGEPAPLPAGTEPAPAPAAASAALPPPAPASWGSPVEVPPQRQRRGWYYAALVGLGEGSVRAGGRTQFFGIVNTNVPIPFAWSIQAGGVLSPRLLLGAELDLLVGYHDVGRAMEREVYATEALASATFFPLFVPPAGAGTRAGAPNGWFLRGGAGLAWLDGRFTGDVVPLGEEDWSRQGVALLCGTGWAWAKGESGLHTLDVALDVVYQRYGADPAQPQTALLWALTAGVAFF